MDFCGYVFSLSALEAFLNTQFVSSLLGALAGAFAGAIAAHRISENAREKKEMEDQIRATNAAIMSSFITCNAFLVLKKQQVAEMYKVFLEKRTEYEKCLKAPPSGATFYFEADLRIIQLPVVPIDVLKTQAYEKLNLRGRPLGLVAAIANAMASLEGAISVRDAVVEHYKRLPAGLEKVKTDFYFGFPLPSGSTSTEYADAMEGIHQYTDDIIFYCSMLCSDLERYGNAVRQKYLEKHNAKIDVISSLNFDKASSLGLMPSQAAYEDWLSSFGELPNVSKTSLWSRLLARIEKFRE